MRKELIMILPLTHLIIPAKKSSIAFPQTLHKAFIGCVICPLLSFVVLQPLNEC
ncbi:MAG: hypothetical protein ICV53_24275 [Flavisolibacter sp.]|nr:hypothetical protein [Flavisolibacter sp.]